MEKKIFLTGNTLHLTLFNNKFNSIYKNLIEIGYTFIEKPNASINFCTFEESIRIDIGILLQCEELHLLSDWRESQSAILLHEIADNLGMLIYYH